MTSAAISYLDYVTPSLRLSIFYLPVIFLASWLFGRPFGMLVVVTALVGWVFDYLTTTVYAHPFYYAWDILIRLVTWAIFIWLVTELKVAMINADERFIALLKSLDSAVCVSDLDNGTLLYLNGSCLKAFGDGPPLGRIQQIDSRLTPPPLRALPNDRLQPVSDDLSTHNVLECFDAVSGRWYLVCAYRLQWVDGQMTRIQIATDITEYRRVQEINRRQQEKLEMGSRLITLGGMASTLAHELNQPLAAIANYNRGAIQRLRAGNADVALLLEALGKSAEQAERAGRIVQRARALAMRRTPEMESLDLNEVIISLRDMVELNIQQQNARVALALAPALPAVRADRVLLEQLILNLTRNALHAMQDTPLPQRLLKILTAYDAAAAKVELQVIDNGSGLHDDLVENLFQPFFTTKPEGLGLGLSLCRSIAELHQGRLWATPNPSGGSIFHFTLRAAEIA